MIRKFIVTALCGGLLAYSAHAATPFLLDMEGAQSTAQNYYVTSEDGMQHIIIDIGGFRFTGYPDNLSAGAGVASDGEGHVLSAFAEAGTITMTMINGGAFDLKSFDFDPSWGQRYPVAGTLTAKPYGFDSINVVEFSSSADSGWAHYRVNLRDVTEVSWHMGMGTYALDNLSGIAGVPEPQGWVTMLAGFGLTGAAMRHRRQPAHSRSA